MRNPVCENRYVYSDKVLLSIVEQDVDEYNLINLDELSIYFLVRQKARELNSKKYAHIITNKIYNNEEYNLKDFDLFTCEFTSRYAKDSIIKFILGGKEKGLSVEEISDKLFNVLIQIPLSNNLHGMSVDDIDWEF